MRRIRKIIKTARGYEPEQSEEDVVGAIRALLEMNGARVHRIVERIPWGKKTSTPGIPDLTGWFPLRKEAWHTIEEGKHFWIEVKRLGGKLRPAQSLWLEQAQADGVIAFKAESVEEMGKEFLKWGIKIKGL